MHCTTVLIIIETITIFDYKIKNHKSDHKPSISLNL